jgi:hypothetical protein
MASPCSSPGTEALGTAFDPERLTLEAEELGGSPLRRAVDDHRHHLADETRHQGVDDDGQKVGPHDEVASACGRGLEDADEREARAEPTEKMKAANPTLAAPAAWSTKSIARRTSTMAASRPTMPSHGDWPDHVRVELLRIAAPVTGSDVVCVVFVTPR